MRRRYKILFIPVGFFTLNLLCKGLNGNFDPAELISPWPRNSIENFSFEEQSFPVESVLQQEFHYLGKGHQAFAFISEDGKYVLKLFKPHYPHWEIFGKSYNFTSLPFARFLYRVLNKEPFQKRIKEDFLSYVNAYRFFKEESLVEYLHPVRTQTLRTPVRLFDKIGVLRTFDPNTTCFLIQRTVKPLGEVLSDLQKQGNTEEIRSVMYRLLELLQKRIELRFYKPTHKFHANFGCVGLQPIQLDIGNLLTPEDLGLAEYSLPKDLTISIQKLKVWLSGHFPELEHDLDAVIQQYTTEKELL